MLQIITHTPIWVFVLFFGLLGFGFLQSRGRTLTKTRAYLLPIAMVGFSLWGVHSSFGLAPATIALWAVGLSVAALVGYRFFGDSRVSFNTVDNSFFMPGSWMPLVVIMAIFFTKYLVAVMIAVQAPLVHEAGFAMLVSLAYGGLSGYFAARALNLAARERSSAGTGAVKPVGES